MALLQQDSHSTCSQQTADVLLFTATEVEAKAVLSLFPEYQTYLLGPDRRPYYDLGTIAKARVFMVQAADKGVGNAGGALPTLLAALSELSPATVIMVGIAFGTRPKEQKIGDILVSTKIFDYSPQRIGTDANGETLLQLRGDRISASPALVSKFQAGAIEWNCQPAIHFGTILSGDKLVDNLEFRNQLLKMEPDAIGGEMEGAALGMIEQLRKVDWILIKAICDWADGEKVFQKRERQEEASDNAARFTIHVLRQGGFERDSGNGILPPLPPSSPPPPPPAPGGRFCSYTMHPHWVLALSWEPDRRRIASVGSGGAVHVWDTETALPLRTYRGHQHKGIMAKTPFLPTLYNVAWSPTEPRIASCGDGREVHVWDANTGGTICVYRGHSGMLPNVFAIDWSPDGQYIASACSSAGIDKTIHIWDVGTGQTIRRCATHAGPNPNFSVLALAWSPDGSRIAATCGNHTILLLNPYTGERIASYSVSAPWTSHIAWSPDGKFLAAAHSDKTVQVWDTSTHRLVLTYSGHTDSVRAVAWSPDGTRIASASNDKTVRLWSFSGDGRGTHLFTYDGHKDWTTSVAWSTDGSRIASGSNDKTVQIWQAI